MPERTRLGFFGPIREEVNAAGEVVEQVQTGPLSRPLARDGAAVQAIGGDTGCGRDNVDGCAVVELAGDATGDSRFQYGAKTCSTKSVCAYFANGDTTCLSCSGSCIRGCIATNYADHNAAIVADADPRPFDAVQVKESGKGNVSLPSTPSAVCPGTSISVPVSIQPPRDDVICGPIGELRWDSPLTGESGQQQFADFSGEFDIDLSIPDDVTPGQTGTLLNLTVETWADTFEQTVEVAVRRPEAVVGDLQVPASVCIDESFEAGIPVEGRAECPIETRVRWADSAGGSATAGPTTLSPGERRVFSYRRGMVTNGIDVEARPQLRSQGEWRDIETVSTLAGSIETDTPQFSVTGINYPTRAQPSANVNASFTVLNVGDCAGAFSISGTRLASRTFSDVGEGQSVQVPHQFTMPPSVTEIGVTVRNETLGEVADRFSSDVGLREVLTFDTTPPGSLAIFGGFGSRIAYSGLMYGSGITGENLERTDVVAGRGVANISGSVAPSGVDIDTVAYQQLSYLYMAFDQEILIVQNAEIKGRAQEFEYNATPAPSPLLRPEGADPDLSLRANPLNPRDVVGAVAGAVPLPPLGGGQQGEESAFE